MGVGVLRRGGGVVEFVGWEIGGAYSRQSQAHGMRGPVLLNPIATTCPNNDDAETSIKMMLRWEFRRECSREYV